MTGFVFKIQANMDPNHRDRIAFIRVCSGRLERGMKAKLVRTGKALPVNAPQFFSRVIVFWLKKPMQAMLWVCPIMAPCALATH